MNRIQQLKTEEEWNQAWPALQALRNDLDRESFIESREDLVSSGYELFGLRSEGRIVCVATLIIHPHVLRRRECRLYDLVTLPGERSKGFGSELLRFVERYARDRRCTRVYIHTQQDRIDAQRFYEEHAGWNQRAYVYDKKL